MKKYVNKKVLATMVCLSLSAGTAYAAELEQQQVDIPDIKPGQEFYINSQGKIVIGAPETELAQTESIQDSESDDEYDDERMLAILRPRMKLTVDGKIIMDKYDGTPAELPEPTVIYQPTDTENEKTDTVATEQETKDNVNLVVPVTSYPVEDNTIKQEMVEQERKEEAPRAQEEITVAKVQIQPVSENNTTSEINKTESLIVSNNSEAKNTVMQKIAATGEMKRNAAEEEMSKLLDKSIARGGVELMVTMLNRNNALSRIDKLNCYIGYCRAVNNRELPSDVKGSLLQLITDTFE